ncbi:MAG: DUF1007 family protein, partial [Candidatus Sumerlaeota bacterium]
MQWMLSSAVGRPAWRAAAFLFLILLIVCVLTGGAVAHPHVFIEYRNDFIFNETGLEGIRCEWKYDAITSADVISNYDEDGDKELSGKEAAAMITELSEEWYNHYYYTVLNVGGDYVDVEKITDVGARQEDKRVISWFTIPCKLEADYEARELFIVHRDSDYYIAFSHAPQPWGVRGADKFQVEVSRRESLDAMAMGGRAQPMDLVMSFREKTADEIAAAKFEEKDPASGGNSTSAAAASGQVQDAPPQSSASGLSGVAAQQKRLQDKMEALLTESDGEHSRLSTVLLLCLISFGYGVLHAAGPGHGK